jgi:hypothetical protein
MGLGSRIVSWGATCMNSWCLSGHRSRKFEHDFLDAEGLWMQSVEPRKRWPFRFRVQTLSRLQAEVCLVRNYPERPAVTVKHPLKVLDVHATI